MALHTLRLHPGPYAAIASGRKTIEARLYDEKRRTIELGDSLVFISREDPDASVRVVVIGLLRYENFHELFSRNEPFRFGGLSSDQLEQALVAFYSADEQSKYGVLGIEFELV